MISSAPASPKILIGISMDLEHSKQLLSWATILAHPSHTLVALHVLETKKHCNQKKQEIKKRESIEQIRRAKAFVISVMGEFSNICQSKQVNLEARVGFNSSVGKGLIEEAKGISAQLLLIGGSRNRSNSQIIRYCFEHAPQACSVVLVGKCGQPQKDLLSSSVHNEEEFCQSSSRWINKNSYTAKSVSLLEKPRVSETETENEKPSPKTVLDACEGESNSTDDYSSSFGDSIITESPPLVPKFESQSYVAKPPSPFKRISSFLRSSFDLNGRKRNEVISEKEKHQPLLRCFSYQEIANSTNDFHQDNIVGRGGYSEVYRGDLDDGHTIAVKRLAKDNTDQNKEKEFLMELGIIGHVDHPNTASLVGYCIENGLHLIFDLSPNGTLASALHGKICKALEWPVRYKIALGVARGLHYLHKCCKHRIIHRDIKASNVLLGPDYEPQISDFGLAKWLPNKWTHHAVIPIEGTFGYLAPEYFMHGIVDEKTDVFAFGVLLLEIITGRRPVDSSKQNLLLWAKPLMESGCISELADPKLEGEYDMGQMHRLVVTASYCVRQSSIWRPSMSEVLELLTYGDDSEIAKSWRMPKFTAEEMDDYSMVFGYELPSDILLEDM
ncbi:probable receptor-like serine/threonine-protein kinase At5g57670 isoform X2 [Cornus florida]|uniref:probable receptor-like serine/threonine-protein kinase At5g57670 isoform X2 n=1 Tax=Cornus florida TaxID=4283 RepID=UPI002898BB18|nr:probable receptor-like serine/threonine-protein kinase At5g57670 isoform X2 [Cornus florida]